MDREGGMEARMDQGVRREDEYGENEDGCFEVHDQS